MPPSRSPRTYRVRSPFGTRWNDNDQYGHLNNTVYYEAMDTAINTWMMANGGLDPQGSAIALCASSSCDFAASASFPEPLEVGIGIERVGTSSITWALGILRAGSDDADAIATGRFVHVFVDAEKRRPTPIPAAIRAAVEEQLIAR